MPEPSVPPSKSSSGEPRELTDTPDGPRRANDYARRDDAQLAELYIARRALAEVVRLSADDLLDPVKARAEEARKLAEEACGTIERRQSHPAYDKPRPDGGRTYS